MTKLARNSLPIKPAAPADLERALAGREHPVWVLGIKTDSFARVAWERGRDVGLALERRVYENFADIAHDILRDGDALVHTNGSDLFGFALLEPSRANETENHLPQQHRAVLAAIERAVRERAGVEVHSGWALIGAGDNATRGLTEAAERGRNFVRRREFAALLHDLTTPVASIHGSLVAATDDVLPADVTRRFLNNARVEAGRVGRLIRGFLAVQNDDVSACDSFFALDRAMMSLEPLSLARNVTLEMCETSVRTLAAICEDRLTAILVSLLENAIKHGKRGGIVRARCIVDGAFVKIEIDDDGPGIPAGMAERIFQFGTRASDTEGSGIGLAHARLLVAAAGGEISASNGSRGGAAFTIRLPLLESR